VRSRPTKGITGSLLLAAAAIAAAGCGGGGDSKASDQPASTAKRSQFSTKVDHPLVPLTSVPYTLFKGTDGGSKTRGTNRVLKKAAVVDGVRVAVLENKEYEGGELVEHTFDYFAQRRDGTVWYFGERVQNYENGKVNHEGQWLAGKGNAKPGIYMPAHPRKGQTFNQERAPGVAEDRSTVLATGLTTKTPAGTFKNCIRVKDFSPIDKLAEYKRYCAGVGLVHESEPHATSDLVRYTHARR
jgi:hypothetical protein